MYMYSPAVKNSDGQYEISNTTLSTKLFVDSVDDLVKFVYPDLNKTISVSRLSGTELLERLAWVSERSILSTTNAEVEEINRKILGQMQATRRTYLSADTAFSEDKSTILTEVQPEVLHSINPAGIPQHELTVCEGALVMLIRNVNVAAGWVNGSKFIVIGMRDWVLTLMSIDEATRGEILQLPRIDFHEMHGPSGFILARRQFPLRLTWATTVHKAQGQSLQIVGCNLSSACFTHGMLYVALSRCSSFAGLRIFLSGGNLTITNTIYAEIIQMCAQMD